MPLTPESDLYQRIAKSRVIAVLVVDSATDAVQTARALIAGGIDAMELTLRTPAALEALRAVRSEVPEMLAGVGTILSCQQADESMAAGAAFGVSPGINTQVVRHATDIGLPFAPGVMTPTDIDQSIALGCRLLKFFPATSSGGLQHLKNIAAPYAHLGLGFVPLGGVSATNLADWLAEPLVTAVGGSWLAPRDVIAAGDWSEIEGRAAEARRIAAGKSVL
jgi:2-dehydro-3-deoxyphosphogluconate aldolase/(4S)-4-hydroxy-2-oxoglutarate aldolase